MFEVRKEERGLRVQKINIISVDNGVGLSVDNQIIQQVLTGNRFNFIDVYRPKRIDKADVNIFLEIPVQKHFNLAPVNIFFPNPEWFNPAWLKIIHRFNIICAKTRDCERIFKQHHKNVVFTSFTSPDKYDGTIERKPIFLHVAGKSETKNTNQVLQAFAGTEHKLICCYQKDVKNVRARGCKNILYYRHRLSSDNIKQLQNTCLFHVCTSEYEGFGHYLHEGKACGVVMTTDGTPMNEFITDPNLLVRVVRTSQMNLGELKIIDPDDLRFKADRLAGMTEGELITKQQQCRESFLKNQKYFKKMLCQVLNPA